MALSKVSARQRQQHLTILTTSQLQDWLLYVHPRPVFISPHIFQLSPSALMLPLICDFTPMQTETQDKDHYI